jgi:acetyl-CoA carboxylase biotin carboxyl carrier protein
MNLKEIEEMIKLMNDNKLSEIEIEKNGLKVRLKKEDNQIKQIIQDNTAQIPLDTSNQSAGETSETADSKAGGKFIEVKAPMVGTFYRAPAPDAEPFVEIGQDVKPDDALCIIEAMKLMNEIKCEAKGKVIEILVENGHPVEYGQTIMLLEPLE